MPASHAEGRKLTRSWKGKSWKLSTSHLESGCDLEVVSGVVDRLAPDSDLDFPENVPLAHWVCPGLLEAPWSLPEQVRWTGEGGRWGGKKREERGNQPVGFGEMAFSADPTCPCWCERSKGKILKQREGGVQGPILQVWRSWTQTSLYPRD